jgi:hypothetical protein
MKKILIAIISLVLLVILYNVDYYMIQHNRRQSLCDGAVASIKSAHDAINVIRNYNMDTGPVGSILSRVRGSEVFENDGYKSPAWNRDGQWYGTGGGWHVEEWARPIIEHGYSIEFEYFDNRIPSELIIRCDVLDCGAIDIHNCKTLGVAYSR